MVPHGFYLTVNEFASTNTAPEECRTCHGQGVLWSRKPESLPKLPALTEPLDAVSTVIWEPREFKTGAPLPPPEYHVVSGDWSDRANWKGKR